jgi:mycofactocin precursor
MSDTVIEDQVDEVIDDAQAQDEPVVEPLIEEISIDGMCGVY